ncbi:anti-anti-sigma factor [Arachidicoccus ginsenosidimutans]|uniref:STAS domain-containing protein n=1 Tax=Arachidicoccus sp. BS20 TaxID=1850526 RepID=UPI0007F14128|nr:STAS domain-containing protein [Arachidicoccus sp. BS20]ANI89598.1 anti-anti-sigma factor [Arachidicoccus sp. BS20]
MKIKVDTKEKFSVLRPTEAVFSVNMAEELTTIVMQRLQAPVKNVIVDFTAIETAEKQALIELATIHQIVYKNSASFVVCNLKAAIKTLLDELDLTDVLNITPTESEAWDIVQMEEIERELFGDEE